MINFLFLSIKTLENLEPLKRTGSGIVASPPTISASAGLYPLLKSLLEINLFLRLAHDFGKVHSAHFVCIACQTCAGSSLGYLPRVDALLRPFCAPPALPQPVGPSDRSTFWEFFLGAHFFRIIPIKIKTQIVETWPARRVQSVCNVI